MPIGKKRKHENFATGDVVKTENGVFYTKKHKNKKIMENTGLLTSIDESIQKHIQDSKKPIMVKKEIMPNLNHDQAQKAVMPKRTVRRSARRKETIVDIHPKLPSVGQGSNQQLQSSLDSTFTGNHF